MPSALDTVRDVYGRFAAGDVDGFLNLCADDIEWVVNGPASLEKCRAFRGRDGVRAFLDILTRTWAFSDFSPKTFIAEGDAVVVLGDETGTDTASGTPFANRWAHVFDVRGGKIVRFREFLCHWTGDETPPPMSWNGG
jgi:uncharacterized protein